VGHNILYFTDGIGRGIENIASIEDLELRPTRISVVEGEVHSRSDDGSTVGEVRHRRISLFQ
jgi:hypothetical protein